MLRARSVRDEYLVQECEQFAEKLESLVEGESSQGIRPKLPIKGFEPF